jgi:two-component system chemotaxis response regulator CheB
MSTRPRPIRVLVVDDSAVVRKLVTTALQSDPEIEVVGTAIDPYFARDKIQALNPDVLTLDIEMPRMDGLTFLKIIMQQRPLPVIILSSLTKRGTQAALEALQLGAFDILAKPGGPCSFGDLGPQLIARIKATAGARLRGALGRPAATAAAAPAALAAAPSRSPAPRAARLVRAVDRGSRDLILLGASTGGTEALREVLTQLPGHLPPIAIVQHIPPVFSRTFAERLNELCDFEVREAVDGDRLHPGLALVAPGNFHLLVHWQVDHYRVRVAPGPAVWHQRPAVDVLFKSAADAGAAPHTLAGIFTGMGRDGADGLLRLRERGASTFAQDEASSVVYGMPRAAWENGAAMRQVRLDLAPDLITRHFAARVPTPQLVSSLP